MPRTIRWGAARRRRRARATHLALFTLMAATTFTAWCRARPQDLTTLSIEQLMDLQVTSVSKTQQTLSQAASAIFVITQDAILRSGATNIPDLLRMVPGLDVARITANAWAISARGFNDRFSNELLVLMDGRTVYTPTFGGVFWDTLDLPLENVERIEVIRGPGSSVWGANAVNGVINIITRNASATHGGLLVGGDGNVEQGFGTTQYGGKVGKSTDYRAYVKYLNEGQFPSPAGGGDGWRMLRGGFRSDSSLTARDKLMFQGDIYSAREGTPGTEIVYSPGPVIQNFDLQANLAGGFLQGVWDHSLSGGGDISVQVFYDTYERNDQLREDRNTYDIDFQHTFRAWTRHNLSWGGTYRYSSSRTAGDWGVTLDPPDRDLQLFSSFLQDQVDIVPGRLALTLGAKFEHNFYTGLNILPSGRVAFSPTQHDTFWAAISRGERTPSELDAALRAPLQVLPETGGLPVVVTLYGNPKVKNEGSISDELGYRTVVSSQLSIDFAAYYNHYVRQNTNEPAAPFLVNTPSPHLVLPLITENLLHGETHGAEMALNWKVSTPWTLNLGYAFEQIHMHLALASQDTDSLSSAQGSSPVNAAQLRSHLALTRRVALDTSAYYAGRLLDPSVPSYTRLDSGLSCNLTEGIALSLVGQNLLTARHLEFGGTAIDASNEIKRGGYAKLEWRFR